MEKLPPGPIGFPLIGNLFDVGPKPYESLAKLAKKHGPLMTIRLGCVTSVVASSPEMAREILQKNDEACSGRTIPDAVTVLEHYDLAVLWMSAGEEWRLIRKALNIYLTHPQKLESLQGLRHIVVKEMLQYVNQASQKGEAVEIRKLAFTTAKNQMSNTCISENVAEFGSLDVLGFQNAVKTVMDVAGKFNIADIFPWLKPFDLQGIRSKSKAAYGWLDTVSQNFIDQRLQHRKSYLPRHGDLLDSILDFSQANESEFNCSHIKILLVVCSLSLSLSHTHTRAGTLAHTQAYIKIQCTHYL
ncbi:unnamed protein product [Ilex paraguariensis]|uniref:Cytochrome P450 n=1 Tax=Ilex paraguariensis TaxID=185542 RepID=A0ABC8TUL8_9AQUA